MKKKFFLLSLVILIIFLGSQDILRNPNSELVSNNSVYKSAKDYDGFIEVDFDYSMGIEDITTYKKLFLKTKGLNDLNFFRDLYNKNKPSQKKFSSTPTIPKIIHQVWVGPGEIPAIYKYYQKTCQDLHPDWEYKLWTDKEVNDWDFDNKDLYNNTRNYAEKSDILRHQLLKDFGGVYIDLDIKCLIPLDPLHYLYDAYFGLEFPTAEWGRPIIAPGIMASKANHKIVKNILTRIRKSWHKIEEDFDNGLIISNNRIFHQIGILRSMAPVTDVFLEDTTLEDNVIALPATYFYPLIRINGQKYTNSFFIRIARDIFNLFINVIEPIANQSMKTWLYDHFRPKDPFFAQGIRKESLSYHDYFEKDTTLGYVSFKDGFGLYDFQRKSIFKNLPQLDRKKFNILQSLYDNNNPFKKTRFNYNSKINNNIHFINLSNSLSTIEQNNIDSWRKKNRDSKVIIWNLDSLNREFGDVLDKSQNITDQKQKEFFIALHILNKMGGIYIDKAHLKANIDLFELNNKFDLYVGILPFSNINKQLTIDSNFYACRANHWITENIINSLNKNPNQNILEVTKDNLYKYLALGGKNIVLPPVYFHPIDLNINEPTIIDRMHQYFFGYQRAFKSINILNSIAEND
jgi:mannosyltransferase OCH1-like enzyme